MRALEWLFARQRFGMKPGLARMTQLLERAGLAKPPFEVVLVAGTNGKGSTASSLATILSAAGRRTGLFTSPHLSYFNERFLVDGQPIPMAQVLPALEALIPLCEQLEATFFECVTLLGVQLFAELAVELAVFEVGIGGRLDATNALSPSRTLITSVDFDHMEILGDTLEQIALEKSGIMRPAVPCFAALDEPARSVVCRRAAELGAPLQLLGEAFDAELQALSWQGTTLRYRACGSTYELTTPLIGRHQVANAALAIAAARSFGLELPTIAQGLAQTRWPGRLERIAFEGRRILLDGAHNPAAAQVVADTLKALLGSERLTLIFGCNRDKPPQALLAPLAPLAHQVIVSQASLSPKAYPASELKRLVPDALDSSSVDEALAIALERTAAGETILVAGSLYLVGELRPLLLGETGEHFERWQ